MTKLEEVARAIGENIHLAWLWDERSARICDPAKVAEYHQMLEKAARAALEAMREPTNAMLGYKTDDANVHPSCHMCGGHLEGWRLMITAALAEGGEG